MSEKESGNTGAAESCLFCAIQTDDRKRIVEENDYAYAIRDGFPGGCVIFCGRLVQG